MITKCMICMEVIPYDVSENSFETTKSDYVTRTAGKEMMEGNRSN